METYTLDELIDEQDDLTVEDLTKIKIDLSKSPPVHEQHMMKINTPVDVDAVRVLVAHDRSLSEVIRLLPSRVTKLTLLFPGQRIRPVEDCKIAIKLLESTPDRLVNATIEGPPNSIIRRVSELPCVHLGHAEHDGIKTWINVAIGDELEILEESVHRVVYNEVTRGSV